MPGVELRKAGTTASFAPIIKRGMVTLTDGRVVVLTIDTNLASSSGTDVTGVAKIYLHLSTDTSRTGFTTPVALTPAVAPASATRRAVASIGAGSDNSIWVAWQGVDNGLYMSRWTYSAGVFTFVSTTTVQASGAITNRFRAIDIDVAGTANPFIGCYEANNATSDGSFARVYCLMADGTTWRRTFTQASVNVALKIGTDAEDFTIACRGDGVVSNVVRYAIYYTQTASTVDSGDVVREYSFNVSSGAADSATLIGTWLSGYNKNVASRARRGMLFTISNTVYLMSGVVGTASPKFWAAKLTTGAFSAPVVTTAGYVAKVALSNYFKIDITNGIRTAWTASYKDNRLIFGFAGLGSGASPRIAREIVFSYAASGSAAAKPTVDSIPRPLDSNYYGDGGPIGVYGGDNKRTAANLKYYNFNVLYGRAGNTVSVSWFRAFRFVAEDTFDPPTNLSPVSGQVESTNRPTFRVSVDNLNLTPNLYGKLEVLLATDSGYTTNVRTITQPDSDFQYFGTKDGLNSASKQVTIQVPLVNDLFQTTWFWKARIVSDKDTPGFYSTTSQFVVSHPPVGKQIKPTQGETVTANAGNVLFSWSFTDTEVTDAQTSYYVIVKRTDTDAVVVDTGWVASSATSANIAVSATYLEVPLSWTIQLKDSDGVAGPVSNPVDFIMGTAPVVDLTSPTDMSVMTTAAPTVTWTYTGSGGRAQKSYRVQAYEEGGLNQIANYSFEVNMNDWTAVGCTATRSNTQAYDGAWSAFCTPDGVTAQPRIEGSFAGSATVIAQEAETFIVDAWIYCTTINKPIQVSINWYNSVGGYMSTSSSSNITVTSAGVWQYVRFTATAPGGAFKAAPRIGLVNTPAAGDTFYVDLIRCRTATPVVGTIVGDSYWRAGIATSHAFLANILENNRDYGIRVYVQDEGNLISSDTSLVHTNWVEPTLAVSTTTVDTFKATVSWTDAQQDADFIAWRVYRRYLVPASAELDLNNTAQTWVLLYETSEQATSYSYMDYNIPLNKAVDYVVVQLAERFGSVIESDISTWNTVTLVSDRFYFVPQIPVGSIASFQASDVTGDQFTREVEQETLHVVGRGRQVQVGDDLGYTGSLSIHLRNPSTARLNREFLEMISADNNSVYIKSPFGDVILVALGNIGTTRQPGYGRADIVDLSVPYSQIFDDDVVTRLG